MHPLEFQAVGLTLPVSSEVVQAGVQTGGTVGLLSQGMRSYIHSVSVMDLSNSLQLELTLIPYNEKP